MQMNQTLTPAAFDATDFDATDFDATEFRAALSHFATGVTVITCTDSNGRWLGLTASSFNSVSLDPPLVLWSLGLKAASHPAFAAASHFAVHVLQANQRDLAQRFASRMDDRFDGLAVKPGLGGVPLLEGASAVFECRQVSQHTHGDHTVFVGEVLRLSHTPEAQPLLYHGGRFYTELPLE
jgi:flavin reductase (DIM6/NTAB) family NADH-FMN oxidoreductase RutF